MINRFARRGNTMTGRTVIDNTVMIKYGASETAGVMTDTAILVG